MSCQCWHLKAGEKKQQEGIGHIGSFTLEIITIYLQKEKRFMKKILQSLAVFSSAVSDFSFVLECLEQRDSLLSLPVTAG